MEPYKWLSLANLVRIECLKQAASVREFDITKMNFNEFGKKQAEVQEQALELLKSIPELEKSGASEQEIEARIEEANRLIAESSSLGDQMDKGAWRRTFEMKITLYIGSMILVGLGIYLGTKTLLTLFQ